MSDTVKKNRSEEAGSIIKNHMIWSMGAGLIPVPVVDMFAVSAIQLDMIRQLATLYDIDFKQTEGKARITALTGTGLARLGARAVKFIPGVGSVLGGVTMAVLSGATSYALGEAFKKHFETGGTMLDFDPARFKKYYNEKFEKGKEIAKEMQKQQEKAQNNASASSLVDKIKELAEMKEKGLINDEEFEALKKKIIN
ncbi:MAG TPA: DUF697 domain-containing protein [Saprospiraceae bacterium]|nr:DUF697 domain-containing protein [Saprospiraceae bacterium]